MIETLLGVLAGGAAVMGSEAVKLATKEAYEALKRAVVDVFGKRAGTALAKLEASPGDVNATNELKTVINSVPQEDEGTFRELAGDLIRRISEDEAAKRLVESSARIRLAVKAGGNISLQHIDGAREIEVVADAGRDFILHNVSMGRSDDQGN